MPFTNVSYYCLKFSSLTCDLKMYPDKVKITMVSGLFLLFPCSIVTMDGSASESEESKKFCSGSKYKLFSAMHKCRSILGTENGRKGDMQLHS